MKREIQRVLFETKIGDRALQALERLTGCGLVPLEQIEDVRAVATPKGNAAAKNRAPTS